MLNNYYKLAKVDRVQQIFSIHGDIYVTVGQLFYYIKSESGLWGYWERRGGGGGGILVYTKTQKLILEN